MTQFIHITPTESTPLLSTHTAYRLNPHYADEVIVRNNGKYSNIIISKRFYDTQTAFVQQTIKIKTSNAKKQLQQILQNI